jgi:PAS domain S-box-containing protein
MPDAISQGFHSERLLEPGDRRTTLLLEQLQRLMAERDPSVLVQRVAVAAREITGASIVGVCLVDDERSRLEEMVTIGLPDAVAEQLRAGLSLEHDHPARRVIEHREIVAGTNPSGRPEDLCLPREHPPVHSFLFVPIASPSRVYGWLALFEKADALAFSEVDTLLATSFGAQVGMVYENARLLAQLQQQAKELQQSEELVDYAMSASRSGVAASDVDSGFVTLSRSILEMLGLPPDIKGLSRDEIYEYVHPDDRDRIRAAVQKAVAERSECSFEFRFVLPAEGPRWFQFQGRVVTDAAGRPARIMGGMVDITERRSLELQVRHAQKMEAVGQLAGGVAHDFNNLLTAIIGYSRFALERTDHPDQKHDIDEILKAAVRGAALTKQLLSFSRRHLVEATSIDLNVLIVEMVAMLRRMIGEDITLLTSLGPDLSHVRADRSQLGQVLMNLVINARDASSGGGRIRIETTSVTFDPVAAMKHPGLTAGSYVVLSVIDHGSGMTDDIRARLFEPFFTTKPRGQGTGLGLATVYGIVVQSGGSIEVESEPGRGSTFRVYLPSEATIAPPIERPVDARRAGAAPSVLLVEDEPAVRELVRMMLERAGFAITEAANPEQAEAVFASMSHVDLLLTDVVMPGRTGFELFRALVARTPSLRVLFMSGYTDYAMFDRVISEHGAAFIEKPFSADALVTKVRDVLSQ